MRIPIPTVQRQVAPSTSVPAVPLLRQVPLTGVQDLANAFAGVAEQARQVEHEQDKARSSEQLAKAQLELTRREIEARKAFDPAKSDSHVEPFLKGVDDYIGTLTKEAVTDGQRRLIQQRMQQARTELGQRAMVFEAGARHDYRRQTLETTAETRAATAQMDPSQAMDLIAQQAAEVAQSMDLSAAERRDLAERSRARIATAAALTLAGNNPGALKDHPLFQYVPLDKRAALLEHASKADRLARSQQAADAIMARNLPLDEAMKLIERDYQGEDERALKVEVQSRFAYAEAARKDREQEHYGTALLEVEQRGRVTPATWALLTDGHRAAVLNRQQAEARQRRMEAQGRPVQTDFGLYLSLREMADTEPGKFKAYDLRQHADKIGPGQLEQLLDIKSRITAAENRPATGRAAITLTQQLNATMSSLGIKKPETRGKFLSYVQGEVDDAMQASGNKPLSFDQRQQIIDKAVLKGPDPDAWLWGEKRLFELTPEQRSRFRPNAPTDAPATEHEALNAALKEQGLPATPANRLALYQRAKGAQ
jgi:hypothetical protein